MASERPTPEEFFAAEKASRGCRVCQHPDRELIDRGFRNGVNFRSMARWTAANTDVTIGKDAMQRHFVDGHFKSD